MANGDILWEKTIGSNDVGADPDVLTDSVLFSDRDGYLYQVNKDDGSVINQTQFDYDAREGNAVTPDEQYVYVTTQSGSSTDSGELIKWNIQNWTKVWEVQLDHRADSVPAVDPQDDSVYVVLNNGTLEKYGSGGSLRWSNQFVSTEVGNTSKPAIDSNGRLYTGAGDVVASIKRDGTDGWTYDVTQDRSANDVEGGPIIDEDTDTIYIGAGNGYVYKFDPSGTVLAKNRIADDIRTTPAFSADKKRVLITTSSDDLVILDPSDLSVITRSNAGGSSGSPTGVNIDDKGRAIHWAMGDDTVSAFDDEDGSVLWTTTVCEGTQGADAGVALEENAIYVPGNDGQIAKLENDAVPWRGRQNAFELPYYHRVHHNYAPSQSKEVLLLGEDLALRGGTASGGDDAVLYDEDVCHGQKTAAKGDSVVVVAEDLAQK